jgi:transcriptional regulator with XRE-family HTH domain
MQLNRTQVAELISQLMQRGIELDDLSEASGVSQGVIILIMKGQLKPSPEIRHALAKALGLNVELLV